MRWGWRREIAPALVRPVRGEAAQGSSVAIFELPASDPARALVSENGIPNEADIILRRVVSADGRTRAFVNDEPVSVALLRDLGAIMVEIHGQSDDRGLFDVSTHRKLLDAFGAYDALLADVAARFSAWDAARKEVEALRRAAQSAAADADYLRHTVEELSALAPVQGEEEELAGERALLMNATRIAEDISAAIEFAHRRPWRGRGHRRRIEAPGPDERGGAQGHRGP